MPFDLSTLAQKDSATLHLRHPVTGDPLFHENGDGQPDPDNPLTIELASLDSEHYRAQAAFKANRRMQDPNYRATAESNEADAVDVLAFCTKAWNLTVDGKQPVCSAREAAKLYYDPRFGWLRLQVDRFLSQRGNFVGASTLR